MKKGDANKSVVIAAVLFIGARTLLLKMSSIPFVHISRTDEMVKYI